MNPNSKVELPVTGRGMNGKGMELPQMTAERRSGDHTERGSATRSNTRALKVSALPGPDSRLGLLRVADPRSTALVRDQLRFSK